MIEIEELNEEISVYDINVENNHNFYANDILVHNCQESYSNFTPSKFFKNEIKMEEDQVKIVRELKAGLVHTCNLNSLNLSNIKNDDDLRVSCEAAVRLLDNAIDFTDVPIKEGEIHNNIYRTIGVGSMGLADYLANKNIAYSKSESIVDELFEKIAYYTINASIDLAKERGKYPKYEGSDWSNGLILGRIFYGNKYVEYSELKDIFSYEEIKEIISDEELLKELFESLGKI